MAQCSYSSAKSDRLQCYIFGGGIQGRGYHICTKGLFPKDSQKLANDPCSSYRYNLSGEVIKSRQRPPVRNVAQPANVVDEKLHLSNRRTNFASPPPGKCLSSIQAPVLLNLSYIGKYSLKIGDKMTWVYSIRQGTIPLAWVTLSLSNIAQVPYYYCTPPSTVSHNFSVPWNLDS